MISFFMFRDLTIKYKGFKTFVFGFQKPKTNAACQNVFLD